MSHPPAHILHSRHRQTIFKRWYFWLLIIIVAATTTVIAFNGGTKRPEFVTVIRGRLSQELSLTGRVQAIEHAELGLERSGRVSWITAKVGERISVGQILLSIENGDLVAELEQAKANLKKAEAEYAGLKRGARPEELRIKESEAATARLAAEDAKKNLLDTIADGYTKTDDAIRNKVDNLFSNPRSINAELNFTITDRELENKIESERYQIELSLLAWEKEVRTLSITNGFGPTLASSKKNFERARLFLERVGLAVNGLTSTALLSQTAIDGYKSNVSTARTNVNTATSNLTSAEEKLRSAEGALATVEYALALTRAGNSVEELAAEEAAVEYAHGAVKRAETQVAKTLIRAPFGGVVVKQEGKIGEILPANTTIITLISDGRFEIEANVPEADIAKVKLGDSAVVTLDAYGSEVEFAVKVSLIEAGETLIDGVPTYKARFSFEKQDQRIKNGMTANIDIKILSPTDALLIPQKVISKKNGDRKVMVFRKGELAEVKVRTGLRGDGGLVEILDGLIEGESVLIPEER